MHLDNRVRVDFSLVRKPYTCKQTKLLAVNKPNLFFGLALLTSCATLGDIRALAQTVPSLYIDRK